jgi:hypothetical protein
MGSDFNALARATRKFRKERIPADSAIKPLRRLRVEQVPFAELPPLENPVTPEDIERAVRELRERKAREEKGEEQ